MKELLRNIWYMARRFKTATVLNFMGLTVAFAARCLSGKLSWEAYSDRTLIGVFCLTMFETE